MTVLENYTWKGAGGRWYRYFPNAISISCETSDSWLKYSAGSNIVRCHSKLNPTDQRAGSLTIKVTYKDKTTALYNISITLPKYTAPVAKETAAGSITLKPRTASVPYEGGTVSLSLGLFKMDTTKTITCITGSLYVTGSGTSWTATIPSNESGGTYNIKFSGTSLAGKTVTSNVCTITQTAKEVVPITYAFSCSPTSANVLLSASTLTVKITSTSSNSSTEADWSIYSSPSWIKCTKETGKATINIDANTGEARSGSIVFKLTASNKTCTYSITLSSGLLVTYCYYNYGTAVPTTEDAIEANLYYKAVTSSATTIGPINMDDIATIWVAVPNGWKLSSWKDSDGDQMSDQFTSGTVGQKGMHYAIVGLYTIYSMVRLNGGWNNTYTIIINKL